MNLTYQKLMAQRLYTEQGYNGKQVAQSTGITEKTVGRWIKKYQWKECREKFLNKRFKPGTAFIGESAASILDLKNYLQQIHPVLHNQIEQSINAYIKLKK